MLNFMLQQAIGIDIDGSRLPRDEEIAQEDCNVDESIV